MKKEKARTVTEQALSNPLSPRLIFLWNQSKFLHKNTLSFCTFEDGFRITTFFNELLII
jgi:hypothetical protein